MALFAAALFLGQGLGPLLGGTVTRAASTGTLFLSAGLFVACLSLASARLIKPR